MSSTVTFNDFQIPQIRRNSAHMQQKKISDAAIGSPGASSSYDTHRKMRDPLDELNLPVQVKSQLILDRMEQQSASLQEQSSPLQQRARDDKERPTPPYEQEKRTTPTPIAELLNRLNTPYGLEKLREMGLREKQVVKPTVKQNPDDTEDPNAFADRFDLKTFTKWFDVEKLSTLKDTVLVRDVRNDTNPAATAKPGGETFLTETNVPNTAPHINVTPANVTPKCATTTPLQQTPSKLATTMAMLNAAEEENKELSVHDITFVSLDRPPIKILYDKLAENVIKNIQIPAGPFENQLKHLFAQQFNSKENFEIVERLFWFSYCAFFQVESLRSLLKHNGLVEELATKLTSYFWKTPPKLKTEFFDIYPHAVSYSIIKALKTHFPDSRKNFFSKQFYVRIHQLLSELLTGIRFGEGFVSKQLRVLFPQKKKDLMGAMLRSKKERGYYSSDDETPAERATEEAEDQAAAQPRRKKPRLLRGKSGSHGSSSKKVVKQTLSEFISSPPDIKGEIDALCQAADNVVGPPPLPAEDPYANPIRHSFMNRTRSTKMYHQSLRNLKAMATGAHNTSSGAVVSLPSIFSNPNRPQPPPLRHTPSSASVTPNSDNDINQTARDPRFSANYKPDENYTIEKAKNRLTGKKSPNASFSGKLKVRLQFIANANAAKEKMLEEKRKTKSGGKKISPRLDTPELLEAMQEIRKRSKQLNSDSVAFGSVNSGMATTMCMSPLLSMAMEPPMEFASPGKRRYLKLDQGNVVNPQFFFHPSDPKKVQHHIIRHHNLWTFPDSKLHFKYSLMRQKLQLQEVDKVNSDTLEEMQRIEEKNKQALSVIQHEEQQILADNTGEKLKEMCRKLIDKTVGQHVKVDLSETMKQRESSGIAGEGHHFRGTNLVVYALNHSERLRDELNQFEMRLDSIVSKKLKGG